jgi:uncharacterized protein (DUF305 family)
MMGQGGMGMMQGGGMMGGEGGMGMMGEGGMGMMGGGMGMMGEGGMGMMGGGNAQPMSPMSDMPMMNMLQMTSAMNTVTMGQLLERTADLDETTPLVDILNDMITTDGIEADVNSMGSMTQMQMFSMFAEMHNLTVKDMREMVGHLDDGENATIMTLMQHHMDVMVGGEAAAGENADEHAAHHPEGEAQAAPTEEATDEHSQHEQQGQHQQGSTQSGQQHQGGEAAHSDPAMTMGMFAGLHALTGVEYEIAWLEAMIDHHDDALHMAERILENAPEGAGHAELRQMAQQIITDQTAEIEAMEALITELSQ